MIKLINLFAFTALAFLNGACNVNLSASGNNCDRSDLLAAGEQLRLGEFTDVRIGGDIRAEIKRGQESTIKYVNTSDDLLACVVDNTLYVEYKSQVTGSWFGSDRKAPSVEIAVSGELDAIRMSGSSRGIVHKANGISNMRTSGSSRLEVYEVDTTNLSISTSGSSRMIVSGNSDQLQLSSSGSSRIEASGLKSDKVRVNSSGSSRVEVYAMQSLDSSSSGSSRISYKGSPEDKSTRTSGSSRVVSINGN